MYWRHFAIIISILFFVVSMVSKDATGEEKGPETGSVDPVVESSLGMKFVYIPPGIFIMGSPPKEKGREKDEIQHQVTLTRGFYMQTTEVTVGQWRAFVRDNGFKTDAETGGGAFIMKDREWKMLKDHFWDNPGFSQSENHPVTCVSWNDAQAFVKWLSQKEGKTYRLPTEAEWEYGCRAGTRSRFSWGDKADCSRANFGNSW
ncbi:MAG: formylglycine-generating enzyme family protein, partial [Thermodesulfobacteriota bacterium]|nr:formylglycine-generating enzyme family protein [Thermodesulfobacteriota bacterium]